MSVLFELLLTASLWFFNVSLYVKGAGRRGREEEGGGGYSTAGTESLTKFDPSFWLSLRINSVQLT